MAARQAGVSFEVLAPAVGIVRKKPTWVGCLCFVSGAGGDVSTIYALPKPAAGLFRSFLYYLGPGA